MVTSTRSKTNGSSVPRRPFGQKDAFELRSESQTELHEINVEYRFEVSHAQQGQAHQGANTHADLEARDGADSEKAISILSDKGSCRTAHAHAPVLQSSAQGLLIRFSILTSIRQAQRP